MKSSPVASELWDALEPLLVLHGRLDYASGPMLASWCVAQARFTRLGDAPGYAWRRELAIQARRLGIPKLLASVPQSDEDQVLIATASDVVCRLIPHGIK